MRLHGIECRLRRRQLRRDGIDLRCTTFRSRANRAARQCRLDHDLRVHDAVLLIADFTQNAGNDLRTARAGGTAWARIRETTLLRTQRVDLSTLCVDLRRIVRLRLLCGNRLCRACCARLLGNREGDADSGEMILGSSEVLPDEDKVLRRIRRRRARLRKVVPRILEVDLRLCKAVHRRMVGADLPLHIRHIGEIVGDIVQSIVTCRHRPMPCAKGAERTHCRCRRAHETAAPHPPS